MLGLSFTKTKRCSPTSGEPTPVSANRRETLRKLLMVDATRVHTVEIRQEDGTVARFLQSALKEAFAANVRRIRGGEDVPAEYPLTAAAQLLQPQLARHVLRRRHSSRGASRRALRVKGFELQVLTGFDRFKLPARGIKSKVL
jgi:hypothetical protein